jgi:release factor glutamine methyltransferase
VTPSAARPIPPAIGSAATTRGALVAELTGLLGGAHHEARFIADEVLGPAGSDASAVSPGSAIVARALARRRRAGEPLQYVFGHWAFRGLDLVVDPRVLIPRPETEQVVEVALAEARLLSGSGSGLRIVDAGTGSGAIALSLATELPGSEVWATDASADALAVAAVNLERVRADHPHVVVELVEGSWLQPLPQEPQGQIELIVSNPPYVSEPEWDELPDEVRAEPRQALVAGVGREGTPGLADVETVLEGSFAWLTRPGCTVVELAPHQAEPAARVARTLGYDAVQVEPDLAGRPRTLVARVESERRG